MVTTAVGRSCRPGCEPLGAPASSAARRGPQTLAGAWAVRTLQVMLAIAALAWLAGCAAPGRSAGMHRAIAAALAHPQRPESDRLRDADRRPADVLAFAGVAPGQRVLELVGAGGYYTELLARTVGAEGQVYVTRIDPERLAGDRLPNVQVVPDAGPSQGNLDLVFTALNYHDIVNLGIERGPVLANIAQLLRPGGRLVVIDHAAIDGSGARDVGTLHRIDPALVIEDVTAAGLVAAGSSAVLANPDDDHTLPVFDPTVRGRTDRFVLLFVKPAA